MSSTCAKTDTLGTKAKCPLPDANFDFAPGFSNLKSVIIIILKKKPLNKVSSKGISTVKLERLDLI